MNLLVTGGCGFIGSAFIRQRLRETKDSVNRLVNLDKLTYAGNPANVASIASDPRYQFIKGDIGDESLIYETLVSHEITAVVNFAAESHVDRSIDSPEPFIETNVVGTLRLLNACKRYYRESGCNTQKVFRFLHVSTDEVYGTLDGDEPAFAEDTPFAPNSPYAASKAASDHIVRAYYHTYGLPVLTTNCSNNYGPYHFPEKLIPLVILNALEGKAIPVYGDGLQIRDWLYVEDHISGIWLVLQSGRVGETYNIGGLNEITNIEIVRSICTLLDHKVPRQGGGSYTEQIRFVADRPGHDRRYAIDCTKIQKELNWKPLQTFAGGLEKTVNWFLIHRQWAEDITKYRYARERLGTTI